MAAKNVTYRLDERTLDSIDVLATGLGISKTDAVRQAVAAFHGIYVDATTDALTLRYALTTRFGPEAKVTIAVGVGENGEPAAAAVGIDGKGLEGLGASVLRTQDGMHAAVFLEFDSPRARLIPVGDGLVRAIVRFDAGVIAWPAQVSEVVVPVRELVPATVRERVEA